METTTHFEPTFDADGAATLRLGPGETAWDPSSTKRDISGPARVRYRRYPDGGIDVRIDELEPVGTVRLGAIVAEIVETDRGLRATRRTSTGALIDLSEKRERDILRFYREDVLGR